jgi:hypothetical protein
MAGLQIVGGARINNGHFEAWLFGNGKKHPILDSPIKGFLEDHFNFLLTEEPERRLTPHHVMRRSKSRAKQLDMTSFEEAGGTKWTLYRKDGSYAVVVVELPTGNSDDQYSDSFASIGEEDDN